MGRLRLPSSGAIYFDTNVFIYSVERIEPFSSILKPAWEAAARGDIEIVASELVVVETLVQPMRDEDETLAGVYRDILLGANEVRLIPVDIGVLERAASLRARTGLKTPDAIHAATALITGVSEFLTNDVDFRRVEGLGVSLLSELDVE